MVTQPDVDGGVWVHVAVGPRSLSATACLAIVRYYIVAKMDGETMQLHINGELEGITRVYGGMRVPPRSVDGDVTVGCGMYAGKVSDVCSCLITEARVSEGVRRVKDWLWRPAWLNESSTCAVSRVKSSYVRLIHKEALILVAKRGVLLARCCAAGWRSSAAALAGAPCRASCRG
jgi:hypothetical protein